MTVTRTDDSGNPLIQFERQSFQQVHGLGLLCVYTAVIIGISHSFGSPRMRKISVNLNMHPPLALHSSHLPFAINANIRGIFVIIETELFAMEKMMMIVYSEHSSAHFK